MWHFFLFLLGNDTSSPVTNFTLCSFSRVFIPHNILLDFWIIILSLRVQANPYNQPSWQYLTLMSRTLPRAFIAVVLTSLSEHGSPAQSISVGFWFLSKFDVILFIFQCDHSYLSFKPSDNAIYSPHSVTSLWEQNSGYSEVFVSSKILEILPSWIVLLWSATTWFSL